MKDQTNKYDKGGDKGSCDAKISIGFYVFLGIVALAVAIYFVLQ